MRLVTCEQIRELDRRTIELGTPGLELMERAGAGVAAHVAARFAAACRKGVLVVAGRGNNGGDGFVVARLLRKRGFPVRVILLASAEQVAGEARVNLDRWRRGRGKLIELREPDEVSRALLESDVRRAGVIVDAILGTGLRSEVRGLGALAIEALNAGSAGPGALSNLRQPHASSRRRPTTGTASVPVVSIDLPSGLDADTGEPWGHAVHASDTVTLGAAKIGLVIPAARPFVGNLSVVDIGLAAEAFATLEPRAESGDLGALSPLLPRRSLTAHKGRHGHLLIVAGSRGKSGAAILAARGALRGGAGLVTVACPESVQPIVASGSPELMTEGFAAWEAEEWRERVAGKTALVVGPGLGTAEETARMVHELAMGVAVPMVVDADGLNVLAGRLDELRTASGPRILTPHPGEMSRLVGRPVAEIQRDRARSALELAKAHGVIVVLKGAGTLTAAPDGRLTVNTTGGPVLSAGGTGDVLAGLIGSLLAQGLEAYDAARLGVYLHGRAGDRLAERVGDAGLLASEIAAELPLARRELTS